MMPNLDAGRIRVRLACADGRVSAVQVGSERPEVARVLRGRTAEQAVQWVPLLFVLCGQAQAGAAVLALAAARGEECPPRIDPDIQREVLREHLWRCLLDLPPLLGEAAWQPEFVAAVRWVAAGCRDELHALLTSPRMVALRGRLQRLEQPRFLPSRLLPPLSARDSLAEWPRLTAEFCRQPDWRGLAAETGVFARRQQRTAMTGTSLGDRWQARFGELLDCATGDEQVGAGGTASAIPVAPDIGRSLVETARGLLMHEIVLEGERVADYLLAAPTEWNFHPQGALFDHLVGSDAMDRNVLQQQVAHTVAALDPCVPWELEWA